MTSSNLKFEIGMAAVQCMSCSFRKEHDIHCTAAMPISNFKLDDVTDVFRNIFEMLPEVHTMKK